MLRGTKINLFFLFLFTITLSGCGMLKRSSKDKAMAKELSAQKASEKEVQDLEKAFIKAQTRETRKMMQQSRKQSTRLNRVKKR